MCENFVYFENAQKNSILRQLNGQKVCKIRTNFKIKEFTLGVQLITKVST